jgi:hypothetical protein
MKRFAKICTVASFAAGMLFAPAIYAQQNQIVPGTQVRLTLAGGISTSVAHDGDPFTAVVAEPVFVGNQLILPAGAKVHGTVTSVTHPKLFSMFRGGASMSLSFTSIEVESRIFPARMSILNIYNGGMDGTKSRKDLKTVEGEVVEENRGVKNDVMDVAIGTAGGSTVGLLFSHVLRGTVFGLVGGSAYVVAKKGKDVELPAQTGMLVRMDSSVAVPELLLHNAAFNTTTSGGH